MNIPGDFWRNGRIVGIHVSVIGGDEVLTNGPIIPSVSTAARQQCRGRERKRHAPDIEFLCRWPRITGIADGPRTWNLVCVGAFNLAQTVVVGHGACSLAQAELNMEIDSFPNDPVIGVIND